MIKKKSRVYGFSRARAAEQVRTEFEDIINLLEEKFKLTSSEAIQLFKEMFNADYSC